MTRSKRQSRAKTSGCAGTRNSRPTKGGSELIYGIGPVTEALLAEQRQIENINVAIDIHSPRIRDLLKLARSKRIPVRNVPKAVLARVAGHSNHQGVVATVAAIKYFDPETLLQSLSSQSKGDRPPLVLVLDGIEDPRNLGALIRTAECGGVDGIFIPVRHAVGLTETVAKTSAGAIESVKIARVPNIVRLIEDLKEQNVWTIGAASNAEIDYTEWDFTRPSALVLGGEAKGLRQLVRERCDALVRIPMAGAIESLNVSVAAGVLLFEANRQRRQCHSAGRISE